MVQVLTARNWRALLAEAQRVLQRRGALAIGKTEGPPDGIDATMRNRLEKMISDLGTSEPSPDRGLMGEWLRAKSSRHMEIRSIHWTEDRTARDFFLRKRSAARFASLPVKVRETALQSLAAWTEQRLGSLDTPVSESYHFCLDLYWFQSGGYKA